VTLPLRDYQQANYSDINAAWQTAQNVLYVAPCRSGKTVVMSKAIEDNKGASIVVAHRSELVQQMSLTLARRGIRHKIIGNSSLPAACTREHLAEVGKNFISPHARCYVASAQTLMRLKYEPWMSEVTLWVTDEGHHYYVDNTWTSSLEHFKNARGLSVTATPIGTNGRGLGRHADGLIDSMVLGPTPRELIKRGYLTDYRIYAPPSDLDLSSVTISANGDYSPPKLAAAVHASHITGDIVQHYLRITPGKLGMTFATDIESATEIAAAYRQAGVPAEVVSGKTPAQLRRHVQQQHQRGELRQIVSVDVYGEGIDVPNLEVVSFGRPTQSLGLYIQQFWRPGNPRDDKPHFTVIDHVGNVVRHGLPDAPRQWSLDRRERKARSTPEDVVPIRVCVKCLSVYERVLPACPFCGEAHVPATRGTPEAVDGDLHEMAPELLARLRGEVAAVSMAPKIPYGATPVVAGSIKKNHRLRIEALGSRDSLTPGSLCMAMAVWGGWRELEGDTVQMSQRRFFHQFGIDSLSAQALGRADAEALEGKIRDVLTRANIRVDGSVSVE
jgi:superfamily II DNA or RNA helicase